MLALGKKKGWKLTNGLSIQFKNNSKGGWKGDARRRRYGDVCICIADSLSYTAETNTPL